MSAAPSTVPATQTAVIQSAYGQPRDVLTVSTSHPVTSPGSHHIQVRVFAASINPVDHKQLLGNLHVPLVSQLRFPHVPGRDFSGVVTAVGPSVTRLKVGDEVYGVSEEEKGAFAQFVIVPDKLVSVKPPSLSFTEAATLPLAAQTALSALERAEVSNAKVVIIGASGGVGHFAVQMAKALGASSVIGVCSGANAEFVKGLGADSTIDYTAQKLSEAITDKSVDVVFDTVGGKEQFQEAEKVFKGKGSRFITVVGDTTDPKVSVGLVLSTLGQVGGRKLSGLFSGHSYTLHAYTPSYQLLDRVSALVREKGLKVNIDNSFNLTTEGIVGLYTAIEKKRTRGKLVLEIPQDTAAPTSTSTSSSSSASTASQASTSSASTTSSPSTASAESIAAGPAAGTVPSTVSSVPVSTAIVPNATAESPGVSATDVSTGSIVEPAAVVPQAGATSEGVLSEAAPVTDAPATE